MSSFTTFVRALLVVGSFAAVAPVTGCAAQVGEGTESTGSTSEAIANCKEGDPTCSIFGSTPKGCALNPNATGCPGAAFTPPAGCNQALTCCTSGGELLSAIDATTNGGTCGADLLKAGCGGWNTATLAIDPTIQVPAVASDSTPGLNGSTHWWFRVYCKSVGLPASCGAVPYNDDQPTYATKCETSKDPGTTVSYIIDPTGCSGGTCKTISKPAPDQE